MPNDQAVREKIEAIADDVAEIRRLLTGGHEPSNGIIVRLDRLEQTEKRRSWATHTALAGVIGLVIKLAWGFIK